MRTTCCPISVVLYRTFLAIFSTTLIYVFVVFFLLTIHALRYFLGLAVVTFSRQVRRVGLYRTTVCVMCDPLRGRRGASSMYAPTVPIDYHRGTGLAIAFCFLVRFAGPTICGSGSCIVLVVVLRSIYCNFWDVAF